MDCIKNNYQTNLSKWHESKYLDIWEHIFTNKETVKQCDNIWHLIKILLITPFSNGKLERMFSRMLRVKNDWRNKLGRDQLEALLRISEEGPSIENFNPDIAIESWYNEKVWRLSAGLRNYPEGRKTSEKQSTFLSMITLSDLEKEDEDIWIRSVNINLVYACFIKHNTFREKLFRSKRTL